MSRRVISGNAGGTPFQGLEKTAVLQEVCIFVVKVKLLVQCLWVAV